MDASQPPVVVVGVDGAGTGRHVVEWATVEARRRDRPLHLVHACPADAAQDLRGPRPGVPGADPSGRDLLLRAVAWARTAAPGLEVETVLEHDRARRSLLRAAGRAELVVVGAHAHGGVPGLSTGSTSLSVATRAGCPVVVVPRPPAFPGTGVVVGVDGSVHGQSALRFAVADTERTGGPLTVVHVWDRGWLSREPASRLWPDDGHLGYDEGAHALLLAETLAGLAESHPDLDVHRRLVRHAVPALALLGEAAHARLLVVGIHGRELAAFRFGSVTRSVLYTATVPVAVVPPPVGPAAGAGRSTAAAARTD